MGRTISSNLNNIITSQNNGTALITLVEFQGVGGVIRVCDNTENVVYGGNTYYAYNFSFVMQSDVEGTDSTASVTFTNADKLISTEIRQLSAPVSINIGIISSANYNQLELGWLEYEVRNVSYNANSVSVQMGFSLGLEYAFPSISYDSYNFSGLF